MRHSIYGLFGAAMLLASPVVAQEDFSVIEERIRTLAPSARTIAVSETPIDGILQVQINGEIVYTSADARFMFQGRVIDLDTREDLTEKAKTGIRKDLIDGIDKEAQITYPAPNAEYNLMVFTDIDCGYCRKLHAQMEEYNEQGISISYLSFPRAGVGSSSYDKAVSVWCAEDPNEAMTQAKLGNEPEAAQCDNPVAEQYQLGVRLGVSGTPALLTSDGQLIPGYVPPETLRKRLEALAATSE